MKGAIQRERWAVGWGGESNAGLQSLWLGLCVPLALWLLSSPPLSGPNRQFLSFVLIFSEAEVVGKKQTGCMAGRGGVVGEAPLSGELLVIVSRTRWKNGFMSCFLVLSSALIPFGLGDPNSIRDG